MKKRIISSLLAALLLLAMSVTLLAGCDFGEYVSEYGFVRTDGSDSLSNTTKLPYSRDTACAVKSEKEAYDYGQVEFEFFFGFRPYYTENTDANAIWDLCVYFLSNGEIYTIRTEEFAPFSEYACSHEKQGSNRYVYSFVHSEKVRVPEALLDQLGGKDIQIFVTAKVGDYEKREEEGSFFAEQIELTIPYTIKNGQVVLSLKNASGTPKKMKGIY